MSKPPCNASKSSNEPIQTTLRERRGLSSIVLLNALDQGRKVIDHKASPPLLQNPDICSGPKEPRGRGHEVRPAGGTNKNKGQVKRAWHRATTCLPKIAKKPNTRAPCKICAILPHGARPDKKHSGHLRPNSLSAKSITRFGAGAGKTSRANLYRLARTVTEWPTARGRGIAVREISEHGGMMPRAEP